ncbi:MAG: AMP-binding protein [bacterium]|nr:AMP-binding protein [bacterium]
MIDPADGAEQADDRADVGSDSVEPAAREPVDLALTLAPSDPSGLTLPRFLAEVTRRYGDRIALRFEDRDWTYREVAVASRQVAAALVDAGVGVGDRVAILISNRPEFVFALFGAAEAGSIAVPVNTFATPDERDYILRHSDARTLLMQRHLAGRDFVRELVEAHPRLDGAASDPLQLEGLPALRTIVCVGAAAAGEIDPPAIQDWDAFLARETPAARAQVASRIDAQHPDDDGVLIYTSGTTDKPKGVLHAQRSPTIQNWRFGEYLGLTEDDIVLTAQPFFWSAGISMSLGATLAAGAKLLLQETFDAEAALDCLERERATTLHAWVHQEKAMAEHPTAAGRDYGALHRIEFDSPLAPVIGLEKDVWGLHASYGLTETFTLSAMLPSWSTAEERARNSGVALPGMEIRIVDVEGGHPLPVGESGEIAVRGVTLMKGYWKVPLEHVLDVDGFFHTGDAGRLDDQGRLHWTGRLSGIIKTGGANVSPLEVEKVAADLPGVRAAIAVGVPHPTLGEAIVLCAIPTGGSEIDAEAIRATLRSRLSAYKVPRHVLVVSESDAPTTGTAKIRSDALRELAQARLSREGVEIAGHVYGRGRDAQESR